MNENKLEIEGLRLVAEHIYRVQHWMAKASKNLIDRMVKHDESKYSDAERPLVLGKPRLDKLDYTSEEYKSALEMVKPALEHHYKNNRHHPEHYSVWECGACFTQYSSDIGRCPKCFYNVWKQDSQIEEMTLFDLLEMLCDWKAAGEMSKDGSITKSIDWGEKRFNIPPALVKVLYNTACEMGWVVKDETG